MLRETPRVILLYTPWLPQPTAAAIYKFPNSKAYANSPMYRIRWQIAHNLRCQDESVLSDGSISHDFLKLQMFLERTNLGVSVQMLIAGTSRPIVTDQRPSHWPCGLVSSLIKYWPTIGPQVQQTGIIELIVTLKIFLYIKLGKHEAIKYIYVIPRIAEISFEV